VNDLEQRLVHYFNALNAFDLKLVEAMFAPHAIYLSQGLDAPKQGRAEIINSFANYFAEYSDQVSVDDTITKEAPLIFRSSWALTATSSKTGKLLRRSGTQRTTFNAQGLILQIEVFDL
jgi:SnoaL-like domain